MFAKWIKEEKSQKLVMDETSYILNLQYKGQLSKRKTKLISIQTVAVPPASKMLIKI